MKSFKRIFLSIILIAALSGTTKTFAHCEIPCGIYDDSLRIALLYEHITTVEKSMKLIKELSEADDKDFNQLTRWVMNKEEHAAKIQEIVSQYYLHQRIKIKDPSDEAAYKKYVKQLTLLHEILVYAMKAKQTTDTVFIDKLRETVHAFEHAYFE